MKSTFYLGLTLLAALAFAPDASAQQTVCGGGTASGGGQEHTTETCWTEFGTLEQLVAFLNGQNGGNGGGGGSGGQHSVGGDVPDAPQNPSPATCNSAPEDREAHAQEDGRFLRTELLPQAPAPGSIWRVTYDDGGTEVYVWSGMSAPFSYAVGNTLTCP